MMTLVEYFTRHYTLVLDNDQGSYNACNSAARDVLTESGITLAEYKALTSKERAERFASEIGDRIMTMIGEWFGEAVSTDSIGGTFASEIMILADTEIEYELGDHYMPEDSDVEDYLADGEELGE